MDLRETVTQAAGEAWGVPPQGLYPTDVTSVLPWCKRFRVFMVMDARRRRTSVAADGGDTTLRFGTPASTPAEVARTARIAALNALLDGEGIRVPDGLTPIELASAARFFLEAPGGFVGSRAFFERESTPPSPEKRTPLALWTHGLPPERARLFEEHCHDPVLERDGDRWKLVFSYFTLGGGVERWEVDGDRAGVRSATTTEVLPPRTFSCPYT